MQTDHNAPPINPLPPVVWALVAPMGLIELALTLAGRGLIGGARGVGWRIDLIQQFGFSGKVFDQMLAMGQFPAAHMLRFLTYPFVHVSFTHALFVIVIVMALGKMVGEVFRGWAVAAVFFASAIAGAAAYGLLTDSPVMLTGGYPSAYGLIGAFTFLLWTRLGAANANRARAFTLIGFLLGVQLVFGVVGHILPGGGTQVSWLWVSEIAGFATGFLISFVVAPGGWRHVVARLRAR